MEIVTALRAGPLTTVQDLGRPGYRASGISPGGALDRHAARVANLLVGNPEEAALLELTLGPARFLFSDERLVACCGADLGFSLGKPRRLLPNESLDFSAPAHGCRSWLAISGGIEVPAVMGSRSTDLRGNFGGWEGRALRDGDELPLAEPAHNRTFISGRLEWRAPHGWAQPAAAHPVLRVVQGAEWEDFTTAAQCCFTTESFTVGNQADRMGARLEGPNLPRRKETELLSEAVAPGTIQVAHDQRPILLLSDCQTIGGYPRIAHVITVDLPLAAQLRPNDAVRFQIVSHEEAHQLFRAREKDFALFCAGLRLRQRS